MNEQIGPDLKQYKKLIAIAQDLASTLNLDLLLNRIVHAAADLTKSQAAAILLYDEENEKLYFQAASNLERPFMRGLVVPVDRSIAGWIVKNRQPETVEDPQSDERFFFLIQQQSHTPTENLLGAPMIVKDKVVGVIETINKKDGAFTASDQEILLILGTQAAVAIENARLFAQSDLIAEMVHELRTPLASLVSASHMLLRPDLPGSQHQSLVLTIQSETQRLSDMATNFLDLARLESGRSQFSIQFIEPAILLGECVGITRSRIDERAIKFVWQVPDNLPRVSGDAEKLKQVFLNLLSNAVKYNVEGGKITLSASAVGSDLHVSVADTGRGIPPESMPHLFQKFYRVPGTENIVSGTGLGLSIVKKIVEAHGGTVQVSSEPGAGATFTVILPNEPPASPSRPS